MATFKATSNEHTEDLDVDIKVKNLKVLTSGIVFSPNGEKIEIVVDGIIINFNFIDDEENERTRIQTKILSDQEVDINLTNFNNINVQGKVIPTQVMFTEKFDIYFSYMVNTINKKEKHRQLTYTIYYGDKK